MKCQATLNVKKNDRMPLQSVSDAEIFYSEVLISWVYFLFLSLMAVNYVSRWVEANDHKIALQFIEQKKKSFLGLDVIGQLLVIWGLILIIINFVPFKKIYGFHHRDTTPYHPGKVEVSNRELKKIMNKIVRPNRKDWCSRKL